MGIMYSVAFNGVSVAAAAQDLFEVLAAANTALVIHELHITQSSDAGDTEAEQLLVSLRRVSGAPTSGSGGSTPTPVSISGIGTSGTTVEANNTTQLSGGTNAILHSEAMDVQAGLHYVPTPDARPVIKGATRFLVELETAPADTLTMSGTLIFEEIG